MPSMIEAWFSASDTIRSVSPVIVGITPVLAVKPDWKVRTAGVSLKAASSASSASCMVIVPAMVRTAPLPGTEFADGRRRRVAHPAVMGQAEVVVRGEADQATVVDRHDRALGGRHHPQRAVEMALAERGHLVGQEGERIGELAHDVQSMMTLPESPARAAANAAANSRNPKRWVIAGVMSSPDLSITVILYQVSYISRP